MGCPCRVTMGVVLTINPGRLEFAAGARALLIHSAAHPTTDIAQQPDAPRGPGFSAAHRNEKRADLHGRPIGNGTAGRSALAPEERHTKMRAAGATRKAGIVDRHGR